MKPILRKLTACLTAAALWAGTTVAALEDGWTNDRFRDAGTHLYQSEMAIGSNATYTNTVSWHDKYNREESFALTYTPGGAIQPVVAYGTKLWGTNRLSTITNFLEQKGYQVVGGINADFFSTKTGIPMGMVIREGKLISTNDGRAAVCFRQDGSAFITKPTFQMTLENHGGGEGSNAGQVVNVHHFNKYRMPSVLYMLSSDFAVNTKVSTPGKDVVFRILSGTPSTSATMELEVVEVVERSTSVEIPDDQLILTCDKESAFYGELEKFSVGDRVTFTISNNDPRIDEAYYATGGGSPGTGDGILLQNGQLGSKLDTNRHPRSAVGIKADGTVVLYAIDGRSSSHSNGLTEKDVAEELLKMGCVEALNLDGGGSTAINVRQPGDESLTYVNSPSDGGLRSCATYIMLVNTAQGDGQPAHLHLNPYTPIVLAGSKLTFDSPKATDSGWEPVTAPTDVTFAADEWLGTMEGNTLHTVDVATSGNATATSGSATGSTKVLVVSEVDSFTVTQQGQSSPLTKLTLEKGDQVQLAFTAQQSAKTVYCTPSAFTYTTTGDIGSVDENGLFTASQVGGASGTLTISFGSKSTSIPVTVGTETPVKVEDFEGSSHRFTTGGVSQVGGTNQVSHGQWAGSFPYSFATAEDSVRYSMEPVSFDKMPSSLRLWLQGSAGSLYAVFRDAQGTEYTAAFTSTGTFRGSFALMEATPARVSGGVELVGLELRNNTGRAVNGMLLIDQIYTPGSAADSTPPTLSLSVQGSTITGQVKDNSGYVFGQQDVTLLVDGQSTTFTLSGGTLTASGNFSAAGLHRVTLQAADAAGNLARISQDVENGSANTTFLDMGAHWATPYVQYMAGKGVISGVPVNGGYRFQPENTITRAEFSSMVSRYLGLDESQFQDVELSFTDSADIPQWALNSVKAMTSLGYINGKTVSGGVAFDPMAPMTRAEMFTILSKTLPRRFGDNTSLSQFTDGGDVAQWAQEGAKALVELGVVSGYEDGSLRPQRQVTRAEAARVLYALY
ncbi:MAG: phosphodiester glycosidase family protein [Eubacteriales bacterium]|jgi:hypothetical protein